MCNIKCTTKTGIGKDHKLTDDLAEVKARWKGIVGKSVVVPQRPYRSRDRVD